MSGHAAALGGPGSTHGHAAGLSEHAEHGASKRIVVAYGFWIFLISDIILFAAFFATYAVLTDSTAGGPSGRDLFDLRTVAIETTCLLLSSFTCGLAGIGAQAKNGKLFYGAMAITFLLGAAFLAIELREFTEMIEKGAGPGRSAFPLRLLRPHRLPRPARDGRPPVAADDDGAGGGQGLPRRHPAPDALL